MANEFFKELLTKNGFTDLDWVDEVANDRSYREEFANGHCMSLTLHRLIVGKTMKLLKKVIKNGGTKEERYLAARCLLAAVNAHKYKLDWKAIMRKADPLFKKYTGGAVHE